MSFCEKLAKYYLVILNVIVILSGILLAIYGGFTLATENKGLPSFTDFSIGGLAIAIGVIIFIISFIGLYAAIKESNIFLNIYLGLLIITIILQLVLAICGFIYKDTDFSVIEKAVQKVFDSEIGNGKSSTTLIDSIQQDFKCCGVVNSDYWLNMKGMPIPNSCFVDSDPGKDSFSVGCVRAFKDAVSNNLVILSAVAVSFVIIEILGIISAFVIKRKRDGYI